MLKLKSFFNISLIIYLISPTSGRLSTGQRDIGDAGPGVGERWRIVSVAVFIHSDEDFHFDSLDQPEGDSRPIDLQTFKVYLSILFHFILFLPFIFVN